MNPTIKQGDRVWLPDYADGSPLGHGTVIEIRRGPAGFASTALVSWDSSDPNGEHAGRTTGHPVGSLWPTTRSIKERNARDALAAVVQISMDSLRGNTDDGGAA